MIAFELPLPDAANFALVNRRLSMLIGPTYWPRLRTRSIIVPGGSREQFLDTLTRDLPSWFYCHSCSRLHPPDRIDIPGPLDELSTSLCPTAGLFYPYSDGAYPDYRLYFHHLQLVMRRHYLGPGYGISTDDLSFVRVNELGESELGDRRTTLLSVEARVCTEPARLSLHIQRWTVLHTNVLELAVERAKCVGVCIHHSAEEGEIFQLARSSLEEYLTRSEGSREPKRRGCDQCKFVYQLEILDTGSDGLAIVITKWLDLGSGLTPLDPKWRFHDLLTEEDDGLDYAGDSERCRVDFEKEGGLTHHGITLRNASHLSEQQYRKTMNKMFARKWILQARRRRNMCDWSAILTLSLIFGGWTLFSVLLAWLGIHPSLLFCRF